MRNCNITRLPNAGKLTWSEDGELIRLDKSCNIAKRSGRTRIVSGVSVQLPSSAESQAEGCIACAAHVPDLPFKCFCTVNILMNEIEDTGMK